MRTIIAAAIFTLILAAVCSPLAAQTSRPTFLFLLEGKGVPTGTIHVFTVNSSTGAITEVAGSPFNAGLTPNQLVVDPTGRFVYVTNQQSEDITAFSVECFQRRADGVAWIALSDWGRSRYFRGRPDRQIFLCFCDEYHE